MARPGTRHCGCAISVPVAGSRRATLRLSAANASSSRSHSEAASCSALPASPTSSHREASASHSSRTSCPNRPESRWNDSSTATRRSHAQAAKTPRTTNDENLSRQGATAPRATNDENLSRQAATAPRTTHNEDFSRQGAKAPSSRVFSRQARRRGGHSNCGLRRVWSPADAAVLRASVDVRVTKAFGAGRHDHEKRRAGPRSGAGLGTQRPCRDVRPERCFSGLRSRFRDADVHDRPQSRRGESPALHADLPIRPPC